MKKQYKIITNPPIDSNSPCSYWIEEKSKIFFGLFTKRRIIGNYYISDDIGEMPFFCREDAEERVEQLKSNL